MLPTDSYNGNNNDPQLDSQDYNDVWEDFAVNLAKAILPGISCIGRGPRGVGLTAHITRDTDDDFEFSIQTELGADVFDSGNIHPGKMRIENITDKTFDLNIYRAGEQVQTTTITMPEAERGSRVFVTTNGAYNFQESGIYTIPKEDVNIDDVDPDIRDIIMFTAQEEITEINGIQLPTNTDYHTWLCIGDIRTVGSTNYTVYTNIKFKIFDAHGYAPVSYVDAQDNIVRQEFAAEDARIEQDYQDADDDLKTDYTTKIENERSTRISEDARVLTEAGQDASAKDAIVLSDAKSYTDAREVLIRRDFVDADNNILAQAKSYTDSKCSGILSDSKQYTDQEVLKIDAKVTNKLDKSIEDNKVYATDAEDNQIMIDYTSGDEALSIPYRDANATFRIGNPTENYHPTTKLYVDNHLSNYIPKIDTTVSLEHAVIKKADGSYGLMQINSANNAANAIVRRDNDKQINVPLTPLADDDAASKKYVDDHAGPTLITAANKVYATDNSGAQTAIGYSAAAATASIMLRDNAGRTYVGTPTVGGMATNKDYVDTADTNLQSQIDDLKARGRYLSTWDSTTGKPTTEPTSLPYDYKSGDYYIVSKVGTTNYKPDGTQYTGAASTVAETEDIQVNDTYYFDGSVWKAITHKQKEVAFSTLAGSPNDNAALKAALDAKATVLDLQAHVSDTDIHITTTERTGWNSHVANTDIHVTATEKANVDAHLNNTDIHVTDTDKTNWNSHIADSVIHITEEERTTWNAKQDTLTGSSTISLSSNIISVKANSLTKDLTASSFWEDNTLTGNTEIKAVNITDKICIPNSSADNHAITQGQVKDALAEKIDHYEEMPEADIENLGKIVQYIGADEEESFALEEVECTHGGGEIPSTGYYYDEVYYKFYKDGVDITSKTSMEYSSSPPSHPAEWYYNNGYSYVFMRNDYRAYVVKHGEAMTNGYFYKCKLSAGVYSWQQVDVQPNSGGTWGGITGDIEDQTDLQNALDNKQDKSNLVTAFQATPDNTHYASEKLTKDSLDKKQSKVFYQDTEPTEAVEGDIWATDGGIDELMQRIYDKLFPISTGDENDIVGFTAPHVPDGVSATWTDVTDDYPASALWLDSTAASHSTLGGSLPNIKGQTQLGIYGITATDNVAIRVDDWEGAFLQGDLGTNKLALGSAATGSYYNMTKLAFEASESNSVYSASAGANVVRPTSTVIKVWRRTA